MHKALKNQMFWPFADTSQEVGAQVPAADALKLVMLGECGSKLSAELARQRSPQALSR